MKYIQDTYHNPFSPFSILIHHMGETLESRRNLIYNLENIKEEDVIILQDDIWKEQYRIETSSYLLIKLKLNLQSLKNQIRIKPIEWYLTMLRNIIDLNDEFGSIQSTTLEVGGIYYYPIISNMDNLLGSNFPGYDGYIKINNGIIDEIYKMLMSGTWKAYKLF